jgi:hypothetical protein
MYCPNLSVSGLKITFISACVQFTGGGLDDRDIGVRVPVSSRYFSLLHIVETFSGVHETSYPGGSFP